MTQHTSDLEREWRSEITAAHPTELSQRARVLLASGTTAAALALEELWTSEGPEPSELLAEWLKSDACALVAAASVAGDGALTIADEKLTKLEQLVELVRAQERRLVAAEGDVVLLAELVRAGQGDRAEPVDLTTPPGPLLEGK